MVDREVLVPESHVQVYRVRCRGPLPSLWHPEEEEHP